MKISSYDYNVGTLVVDLVDAKANKLAWYGSATKTLSEKTKKTAENIQQAVTKLFYDYKYMAGRSEPVKTVPEK